MIIRVEQIPSAIVFPRSIRIRYPLDAANAHDLDAAIGDLGEILVMGEVRG